MVLWSGARVLTVLGCLLLVGMVPGSLGPPPGGSATAHTLDEAWLHEAYPMYAGLPDFVDVAYVSEPVPHVGVLFADIAPAEVPDLHPHLATRAYALGAEPLTHDPIVPVMHLLAQGVPTGIRPGAWMLAPAACTMSFVMQDGAGVDHILTAGHCVDRVGQRVSITGHGDIGAIAAHRYWGVGEDYALVRIDAERSAEVDPTTAGWGGPHGTADTNPGSTALSKHYGFGSLTWYTHETRCRIASGPFIWGTKVFGVTGVSAWGDSGSEIMVGDGQALGIITHLSTQPWPDTFLGTRHTHAVAQLERMLGTSLTLVEGRPVTDDCSAD